jgi:hypothetical protein
LRDCPGWVGEAVEEFDFAFGELLADGDAEGDADEVGVFEFDAGALVAVIEEDVESGGGRGRRRSFAGGEEFGSRTLVMVTTTWKGAMEGGRA